MLRQKMKAILLITRNKDEYIRAMEASAVDDDQMWFEFEGPINGFMALTVMNTTSKHELYIGEEDGPDWSEVHGSVIDMGHTMIVVVDESEFFPKADHG